MNKSKNIPKNNNSNWEYLSSKTISEKWTVEFKVHKETGKKQFQAINHHILLILLVVPVLNDCYQAKNRFSYCDVINTFTTKKYSYN